MLYHSHFHDPQDLAKKNLKVFNSLALPGAAAGPGPAKQMLYNNCTWELMEI